MSQLNRPSPRSVIDEEKKTAVAAAAAAAAGSAAAAAAAVAAAAVGTGTAAAAVGTGDAAVAADVAAAAANGKTVPAPVPCRQQTAFAAPQDLAWAKRMAKVLATDPHHVSWKACSTPSSTPSSTPTSCSVESCEKPYGTPAAGYRYIYIYIQKTKLFEKPSGTLAALQTYKDIREDPWHARNTFCQECEKSNGRLAARIFQHAFFMLGNRRRFVCTQDRTNSELAPTLLVRLVRKRGPELGHRPVASSQTLITHEAPSRLPGDGSNFT